MVSQTGAVAERRTPLSKERVLAAAVALADHGGIEAVSMRRLGQELGVDAMALYRHVRSKDDIIDGIVEVVVGEIAAPPGRRLEGDDARARDGRPRRHASTSLGAAGIEDAAGLGPRHLAYVDAILAILLDGGFSLEMAHHALHVLGSRILGFSQDLFQDSARPIRSPWTGPRSPARWPAPSRTSRELASAVSHEGVLGACDDDVEFAFGLDLVLDGLDRLGPGARS